MVCAAPKCSRPIFGMRSDAVYCCDACRVRAFYHRTHIVDHPHPHRDTAQYAQMRKDWPHEHVGRRSRWLNPNPVPVEPVETRSYMLPGF